MAIIRMSELPTLRQALSSRCYSQVIMPDGADLFVSEGSSGMTVYDIERYQEGRAVDALPESVWTRTGRFVSKHRVAFILILVYILVRAFVLIFLGR